jgi:hypothetical protein
MADKSVETTVLVLTDDNGELYAIPQDALERFRISDEQRAQIEQEQGDDVSGYSMYQNYLSQQNHAHKQSEFSRRGEEIRHKADYTQMAGKEAEEGTAAGVALQPQGIKRFFSGVLTTLRLAPAPGGAEK